MSGTDTLPDLLLDLIKLEPISGTDRTGVVFDRLEPIAEAAGMSTERQLIPKQSLASHRLWCDVTAWGGRFTNYEEVPAANLIARRRFGDGPRIAVNAHVDVEPVGDRAEWTREVGLHLDIDGGGPGVVGRGATDTLGGVACVASALSEVCTRLRDTEAGELVVQFVADEEIGGNGTLSALLEDHDFDLAVVVEPTDEAVATRTLGFAQYELECFGRAVHMTAAEPRDSAVWVAAEAVAQLKAVDDELLRMLGDARGTVRSLLNVGTVRGGEDSSLPAGSCVLGLTIALPPGLDAAGARDLLERRVCAPLGSTARCAPVVRLVGLAFGGHACDASIASPWAEAAKQRGCYRQEELFPSACDARLFSEFGVPVLVSGPGSLTRAHGPDEFVLTSELRAWRQTFVEGLPALFERAR